MTAAEDRRRIAMARAVQPRSKVNPYGGQGRKRTLGVVVERDRPKVEPSGRRARPRNATGWSVA
jgi:hypothetical protein